MSLAEKSVNIQWNGEQVTEAIASVVERKLEQAAIMVENEAKRAMAAPKSGKPGPQTRRSAPGQAPAVQSGELVRRIAHAPQGRLAQIVGTDLSYGMYLELGTKNMAQRPWLVASLEKAWPQIKALF